MRELQVHLGQGFDGELVIFRLTGNEIHRFHPKNGENYRTALAPSRFCFEVEIPSRGVFSSNAIAGGGDDVAIRLCLEPNGVLAFERF